MDKKELIIKHAVEIIAQKGFHGATPKLIAAEAGIAVGTIYLYFKSKEEILNHIFLTEFMKRKEFLISIDKEEYSIYKKLQLFLDYHFSELENDEATGTVLIQESTNPQQLELEGVQKFLTELPEMFSNMLSEAQEKDEIRPVNSNFIASVFFHSIRGVVMEVKKGKLDYGEVNMKEELLEFLWAGIRKPT